jgi:polyisoprenoid-binding protein YceI
MAPRTVAIDRDRHRGVQGEDGQRRGEGIAMATAESLATWTIDPVHSSVEFSLEYMGMTTYRTGFRALEGSMRFDKARPAESSVSAAIPVASVDVTNDRLMGRLMDPDLLGGKDHPTITFESTRVTPLDSTHWQVAGDLTINGVTRPVVLDTRFLGEAKHPFSGKTVAAFRAETAINRGEFGVTWNAAVDTGSAYLGERVHITLAIMSARQD